MQTKRNKLIDAICEVYDMKDLLLTRKYTFCNIAIHRIAIKMGCSYFENKLANEIIDIIQKNSKWIKIKMENAQQFANEGFLVLAGVKKSPNGHVVVIRPGNMIYSKKWDRFCPRCVNIGKSNFIDKGVNWAFTNIPDFYVWVNTD